MGVRYYANKYKQAGNARQDSIPRRKCLDLIKLSVLILVRRARGKVEACVSYPLVHTYERFFDYADMKFRYVHRPYLSYTIRSQRTSRLLSPTSLILNNCFQTSCSSLHKLKWQINGRFHPQTAKGIMWYIATSTNVASSSTHRSPDPTYSRSSRPCFPTEHAHVSSE